MFKTLTDTRKAAILAGLMLILAVAVPLVDLGYLIVVCSVVALVWGIARPPLTYFTLRRPAG
jgi:hypothetical protein